MKTNDRRILIVSYKNTHINEYNDHKCFRVIVGNDLEVETR